MVYAVFKTAILAKNLNTVASFMLSMVNVQLLIKHYVRRKIICHHISMTSSETLTQVMLALGSRIKCYDAFHEKNDKIHFVAERVYNLKRGKLGF